MLIPETKVQYIGHTTECKCGVTTINPYLWKPREGKAAIVKNHVETEDLVLIQFEDETFPCFAPVCHLKEL